MTPLTLRFKELENEEFMNVFYNCVLHNWEHIYNSEPVNLFNEAKWVLADMTFVNPTIKNITIWN